MLDPLDVVTRLRKRDPRAFGPPAVDVVLPRVVGGQGGPLVVVLVQQVAQIPGAVAELISGL